MNMKTKNVFSERKCKRNREKPPTCREFLFYSRHGKTWKNFSIILSRFFARRNQAGGGTTFVLTKLSATNDPGRVKRSDSAGLAVFSAFFAQNRQPPDWLGRSRKPSKGYHRGPKVLGAPLGEAQHAEPNALPRRGGHNTRNLSSVNTGKSYNNEPTRTETRNNKYKAAGRCRPWLGLVLQRRSQSAPWVLFANGLLAIYTHAFTPGRHLRAATAVLVR